MDEVKAPAVGRFRKRPVVIEAVQLDWTTWNDVCGFLGDHMRGKGGSAYGVAVNANGTDWRDGDPGDEEMLGMIIPTLEGPHLAVEGDWIIREPFATDDRKFYPCKPDIFEQTYEPC